MIAPRQIVLLVAATLLAVSPAVAAAGKKGKGKKNLPKPACGVNYLPLAQGTTWVYTPAPSDKAPDPRKLNIPLPDEFTIEVVKVEPTASEDKKNKNAGETVTLKESYREVTRETTIRCDKEGIYVDPQSFFYTGEIGGGMGIELTDIKRVTGKPTWPSDKGLVSGNTWREDLTANAIRKGAEGSKLDAHPEARIEIEREVRVGGTETASTATQDFKKANRIDVGLYGRAFGQGKSANMPDSRAAFWFKKGIGLVRVENRFAQTWELSEVRYPAEETEGQ